MECGVSGRLAPIISTFTEVEGVKFYLQNQADTVGTGVLDGPIKIYRLPLTNNLTLRNTSLYLLKRKIATATPLSTL